MKTATKQIKFVYCENQPGGMDAIDCIDDGDLVVQMETNGGTLSDKEMAYVELFCAKSVPGDSLQFRMGEVFRVTGKVYSTMREIR